MRVGVAPWAGAAAALALGLAACLPGADAPRSGSERAPDAEAIEVSTLAPLSAGDAPVLAEGTRADAPSAGDAMRGADLQPDDPTDPARASAAPETAAPETAAPETAAPETAAPETAAPETAAPQTAAPQTAEPETAEPETAEPDAAPPIPALARAQASCAAQGGRLVSVTTGRFACQLDTGDANRRCTARGDCEGECLARSGTCAPARPLFGCHEVLNARGAPVTECRQ